MRTTRFRAGPKKESDPALVLLRKWLGKDWWLKRQWLTRQVYRQKKKTQPLCCADFINPLTQHAEREWGGTNYPLYLQPIDAREKARAGGGGGEAQLEDE